MSLETTIMTRIKDAMKAKDEVALRTLRAIKAAILVEKTAEGASGELTEADEFKILHKLAKQRKESIEIYDKQGRADLTNIERDELAILETFLPAMMSEDEVANAVKEIISQVGATGPKDMGKVMGAASKTLAGKADGKVIADQVKQQLSALS